MEKQEIDLLEEYIATGNKEARNNAQLTDLCDLVDEIRALHPPLPAPDFQERTVEHIAEKISNRKPGRKFYSLWFKSAGWASAAVAAILLVSMGVLPQKPSDQLPSVPTPPVQEAAPSPEESAPPVINSSDTANQRQTVVNSSPEKNTPRPESASNGQMPTSPPHGNVSMGQKFALEGYAGKAEKKNTMGEASVVQERLKAVPPALADESAADIQGKVPFKVLTIPERSPVQVKINDRPPGVTMTYIIGKDEIVVRQWIEEATDTVKAVEISQAAPAFDQAVRVLHDNVIVEVSGNADRAVLEEYARSFQ